MQNEPNDPGQDQGTGGGHHEDDAMVPRSELKSVIEQRQAEKAKRRETDRALAEAQARLAEFEAKDREREEEEMRKRGEFEKLLEAERVSKAELAKQLEAERWDRKFQSTVSAVSAKAGIAPELVEGLLLRQQRVSGADVALEEITDETVTGLAKTLKSVAPSLFEAAGKGGSPSVPGMNMANKNAGEGVMDAEKARVIALAKQHSTGTAE